MESTGGNNKNNSSGTDHLEKFRRGTVSWSRSREDVWKDIEAGIEKMNRPVPFIRRFRYLAAASILALAGISSFLVLYTKEYSTSPDQTSEVVLPDGSSIKLSSNTVVSYHPFTWRFSREVSLDGEAFFDVEKGNKFTVVSDPGRTEVLGTTFNILSSESIYEVTCFTGKVKVTASLTGDAVIITSQQKVSLAASGRLEVESAVNMEESNAWTRGEFFFTSEPLGEVLAKIGRSFGIEIELIEYEAYGDLPYTGNFSKEKEIEDILSTVLQPFGLKFEETAEGEYRVYR
jgi:transmembrane sensor